MEIIDLPIERIVVPPWNPTEMDQEMRGHLRRSLERFGLVVPLVVRPVAEERYETVGGSQRLGALRELGIAQVPCVVASVDETEARLLSQALNHIAGQDNPGLRGDLLRQILASIPEGEVMALLPGSLASLQALTSLGQEDLAAHLRERLSVRQARLRHLVVQLTQEQLRIVEAALRRAGKGLPTLPGPNPNKRGNALARVCEAYLAREEER